MKFQYISDIHMEFFSPKLYHMVKNKLKPKADVLFLCGDICYPNERYKDFLTFCSQNWKQTYFISGNHEYYENGSLEKTNQILKSFELDNVKFLNNETDMYQNYKIIGTTLWSYIPDEKKLHAKSYLNDFVKIDWNVDKYNKEHEKCVNFLKQELKSDINIVLTHHLPSYHLVHKIYETNPMNCCFASDLNYLFNENIKGWFYGHSHKPNEQGIYYTNPIGYIGENKEIFFNKVVDI